jgi:hypothetical protein
VIRDGNDQNGLAVADTVTDVITGDDDCDNSGGRRP